MADAVEKVDIPGCLVDEQTFRDLVQRICDLEAQTVEVCTYEKVAIWGEEGGPVSNNNAQYSYGNGATGNIGIAIAEDWELYAVSYNADESSAGANVTLDVMDFSAAPAVLTTENMVNSGQTGNYSSVVTGLSIPVAAGTVLGFRTNTETGTVSDARAVAWLRREVCQTIEV